MKKLFAFIPSVILICFAFSCQQQSEEAVEKQKSTVIIYGSRYGSTAQTADWIAEGVEGKVDVLAAVDAKDMSNYDFVILGSGIYNNDLHEDMLVFLKEKKAIIKDRIIALFVVCGTPPPESQAYLDMFTEKCDAENPLSKAFMGWLKRELLTPEDLKIIEEYYKSINQPYEDFDQTDKTKCLQFGMEILEAISNL